MGEIISITHGTHRLNDGEPRAYYLAQWDKNGYASAYDRQWTIADIMGFEPGKYYDVGRYTSYRVTVSFQGKIRTYRALVLFQTCTSLRSRLKVEFWDTIVGMGGILTRAWDEKLAPYQPITPFAASDFRPTLFLKPRKAPTAGEMKEPMQSISSSPPIIRFLPCTKKSERVP